MPSDPLDEDLLVFGDEEHDEGGPVVLAEGWRILIVDDEEDVHQATTFALRDQTILGRPLHFLHARRISEARRILQETPDVAVILLDVVMESEHAGLDFVHVIREDLQLREVRIVLRTGQPGYAPELSAIRDYDINDYKTKSELTLTRLVTTLTTAIRSYDQIRTISSSRRGLDHIVHAAADLFAQRTLERFAEGVMLQLDSLLGRPLDAMLCAQGASSRESPNGGDWHVVGATGRFQAWLHDPLYRLDDDTAQADIRRAIAARANLFGADVATLYLKAGSGREAVVYLCSSRPFDATDRQLLEVFCASVAVGFDNVVLFQKLNTVAYTDALTGLPNRSQFIAMIDAALPAALTTHSVVLIDLDHFSEINDALGHGNGDQLLQAVAIRLRESLPAGVALARVGADTFGLFGPSSAIDPNGLLNLFLTPFAVNAYFLRVRATMGIARLSETAGGGLGALKDANIALNRAKQDQRGRFAWYQREMAVETRQRLTLLQDLRNVIEAQGMQLHYQPQIDLATGTVVGVEALLRWPLPDGGYIEPDRFIPVAEYSGLIVDLGEWVIRTACKQLVEWLQLGIGPLRMAINVSLSQFRSPVFIPMLRRAMTDLGVDPRCIELEITESMAMHRVDEVRAMLRQLKQLGVTVAIDDFGTGFSSLSYLQQLQVDRLKIDRAFVHELGRRSERASIPEMIVRLGRSLGLSVIAEGVETEAQRDDLVRFGCDEAQGFLLARPMSPDQFVAWYLAAVGAKDAD